MSQVEAKAGASRGLRTPRHQPPSGPSSPSAAPSHTGRLLTVCSTPASGISCSLFPPRGSSCHISARSAVLCPSHFCSNVTCTERSAWWCPNVPSSPLLYLAPCFPGGTRAGHCVINMLTCACVRVHECACVCAHVCARVYMHVCVRVHVCGFRHIQH